MRKSSRGGGCWAIRRRVTGRPRVARAATGNAAFFGLGVGARRVLCGARSWLRSLVRLGCCGSCEPCFCSDARPERECLPGRRLASRAQLTGATVGSSRGIFREVSPSARSLVFGALCFARAVRGARHTFVGPGTAGRGRGPWGLGMTVRRRRWKGGRPVGCPPAGPRRARGWQEAAPFYGYSWRGSGAVGVRGGAGAARAALLRRKGSVACLHLPLELVSCPGTCGKASCCFLPGPTTTITVGLCPAWWAVGGNPRPL